jgi:uncharacterized protein (TIGR02145 family)
MLRREAVKRLPRGRYNVMTVETVQAMGEAMLAECAEENCVIALGSKIGADYIVRGIISKFRSMLSLTVELYETEYGNLIASAEAVRSADIEKLLEKGTAACAEMYKKFAELSAQTNPEPKPEAAPVPAQKFTFTDHRNSKTYKAVAIGGKIWMAENLNYETKKSWCYGGNSANCENFGRLYTWDAASNACPAGWHLPSREEWKMLMVAVGGSSTASTKLKMPSWGGTDDYGFSALPGGYRRTDGSFYGLGSGGNWWSASEGDASDTAYYRYMDAGYADVDEYYNGKSSGFSVRCVRH